MFIPKDKSRVGNNIHVLIVGFAFIILFGAMTTLCGIFPTFNMDVENIPHNITVPQNIVMSLNNVMFT